MDKFYNQEYPELISGFVLYPWPDSALSGNSRRDRRGLTAQRRQAREIGYLITKDSRRTVPAAPLALIYKIYPPDRRKHDDDNILTAFKSTRDGIFQALGVDDSLVRYTEIRKYDKDDRFPAGAVLLNIRELLTNE